MAMYDKAAISNFRMELGLASGNNEYLLSLAKEAINASHTKRTFSERLRNDGRDTLSLKPECIHLEATKGWIKSVTKGRLFTNDKLYMIMNAYLKNLSPMRPEEAVKEFCKDFARKYPQEYGAVLENKSRDIPQRKVKGGLSL